MDMWLRYHRDAALAQARVLAQNCDIPPEVAEQMTAFVIRLIDAAQDEMNKNVAAARAERQDEIDEAFDRGVESGREAEYQRMLSWSPPEEN